ncbi:hypothetical protein F4824DRAFT_487113 [Ustulina deusta]|nr:hypothetical protein F4824DRAFT_487113 [Ustulina deusta]
MKLPKPCFRSSKSFPTESWRRTAWFNVLFVFLLEIVLITLLTISLSHKGSSITTSTIIYEGRCDNSTTLNMILHLLINLVSSGIAASSNYFMQVLSSPSRSEIDQAHFKSQVLDIGVPSLHNIRFVSRLKSFGWLVLLLSSAPIHLLFNSSVFETTFQGSEWQITIGTESLLNGTSFFPPGASLAPAGSWMPLCEYSQLKGVYYCLHTDGGNSPWVATQETGFGDAIPLDSYWDSSSLIRRTLDSTVNESNRWVRLGSEECVSEYGQAKPREKYGDVVLIVGTQNQSAIGWTRRELFNFPSPSDLSKTWDPHVPAGVLNPLWYSTRCHSNCQSLFGASLRDPNTPYSPIPFDETNNSIFPYPPVPPDQARALGYQHRFQALELQYCLAQPSPGQCKVGLSNSLLLVVIICVFIKLTQCAFVVWKLPRRSLVTLGDAIESFILEPDSITIGQGALDISDFRFYSQQQTIKGDQSLTLLPSPRIWRYAKPRRLNSAITPASWFYSDFLFVTALIILGIGMVVSINSNNDSLLGQPGYLGSLLLANLPQLLLYLCYFTYNSICTRLCVELEWNSYASSFKPLRVSCPAGQQTTSYRLQVPYRYGIPLFVMSVFLHWVLSNAIFVFISEGDSLVAIGYSPPVILALLVSTLVLIPLPILLGFRKLRNYKTMVIGGSNSLVIAASCHCYASASFLLQQTETANFQHNDNDRRPVDGSRSSLRLSKISLRSHRQETNATISPQTRDTVIIGEQLLAITVSKLKWGAMRSSDSYVDLGADATVNGQPIMHLGFGREVDGVCEPDFGHWYV